MSKASNMLSESDLPAYVQREQFVELLQHLFSPEFYRGYALINQLCLGMCLQVVARYQLFASAPFSETRESIVRKIGLVPDAVYLLEYLLKLLVEERYLVEEDQTWSPVRQPNCLDMHALYQQAHQLYPKEPMYDFIACCERGLCDILEGKKEGWEVIFPAGDSTLWLELHNRSLFMRPYAYLAAFLVNSCRENDAAILEIGAGTGAGTALVVEAEGFPSIRVYSYTDVGLFFLRQGQRRFRQPFMDFRLYNVDMSIDSQGLKAHSFDIVVGVNVLHVARHLPTALQRIYELLRPGGYLILGEGSPLGVDKLWRPDLLFGFLKGWWNVEIDSVYRPQAGFLLPDRWQALLIQEGFVEVRALPGPAYFGEDCYGGAIIGRTKKNHQAFHS